MKDEGRDYRVAASREQADLPSRAVQRQAKPLPHPTCAHDRNAGLLHDAPLDTIVTLNEVKGA
jgi:hypothetical protein